MYQTGTIARVVTDRGFGFVKLDCGGPDAFFHFRDLDQALSFGEHLVGVEVECTLEQRERGIAATYVRLPEAE